MSGCGSFEGDGEQGETIQNHPLPFLYCGIQLIVTSSNNSYSVLMQGWDEAARLIENRIWIICFY